MIRVLISAYMNSLFVCLLEFLLPLSSFFTFFFPYAFFLTYLFPYLFTSYLLFPE